MSDAAIIGLATTGISVISAVIGGIFVWLWKIDDRLFKIQGDLVSRQEFNALVSALAKEKHFSCDDDGVNTAL